MGMANAQLSPAHTVHQGWVNIMTPSNLTQQNLAKLPDEIKALVNDGVFAIYSVINQQAAGCAFVLMTDQRQFFRISNEGDILGLVPSIESVSLGGMLTFPGLIPSVRAKVNYA
jgi:hypothetical protein